MTDLVTNARASLLMAASDWTSYHRGTDPIAYAVELATRWEQADPHDHEGLASKAGMAFDPKAAGEFLKRLRDRAERMKGRGA
jgi:hypothetical protein